MIIGANTQCLDFTSLQTILINYFVKLFLSLSTAFPSLRMPPHLNAIFHSGELFLNSLRSPDSNSGLTLAKQVPSPLAFTTYCIVVGW